MSALTAPLTSAAPQRRMQAAYIASLLLGEAVLLILLAKLLPRLLGGGADGETLSVWAVGGTLVLGFAVSRWLANPELSGRQRVWRGILVTLISLQIIGAADLSESARIWDMSWLLDLGSPSSGVWREDGIDESGLPVVGQIDQLIAGVILIPIWFRGVALGSSEIEERNFANYAIWGFFVLAVSFPLIDNAGIEDSYRVLALLWVVVGLFTIALKQAANPNQVQGLGIGQAGLSIVATLAALVVGITLFLLLVTGVVGLIAGSGAVEPVLDVLGVILRAIITAISYILWPLFWLVEQIKEALGTQPPEVIETVEAGIGLPPEDLESEEAEPDPTAGIVLVRVLGGIAAVVVLTGLAILFFRRFLRREPSGDEERESVWSEADVLGDLMAGLRGLGSRFRRERDETAPDAPIAALYYELLDDAESRGATRAVHRTPLQFAGALSRAYNDPLPGRISEAFSAFRYGGREPGRAEMSQLESAWKTLKDSP